MCHENEMGAAKEQHPYIICRLDKQRRWNSGGTVTRPLFMWVATANLYKRSNKLSCILYNVCLLFDQTIWSDTTYRNGIIPFHHIIWCEEASRKSGTLSPPSFLLVFSY